MTTRIFTTEQYEELKNYGKQIEEFIKKEICSQTNTYIYIPIGNEKTKLGNPQYNLYIDKKTIRGKSGHLGICFNINDMSEEIGRDVYIYDSWNYGAEYLYQLCLNWKNGTNIKQQLINIIKKQESESGKLFDNFTI